MIHNRLAEQRKLKGFTQVGVASVLNVARQTYLDVETGKTEPKVSMVLKLSDILECDLHWLITGERTIRNGKFESVKKDLESLTDKINSL